jgi:hypothetical protein
MPLQDGPLQCPRAVQRRPKLRDPQGCHRPAALSRCQQTLQLRFTPFVQIWGR